MKTGRKPIYISVDVEAAGPVPGRYSMLSIGACVVGDSEKRFYEEIKPISHDYEVISMKVGSLGLNCLKPYAGRMEYDPYDDCFEPALVLQILEKEGVEPRRTMEQFYRWIESVSVNRDPWMVTDIQPFDGMFVAWYFGTFCDHENIFGYKGINLDMLYKGLQGDLKVDLSALEVKDTRNPAHNALEDALYQSRAAELILRRVHGEF